MDRKAVAEKWYPVTVRGRAYTPDVELQFGQANKPSPCFYLYRSMVVNPDGGVSPCCVVSNRATDFGQLPAADITQFWNNDRYQSARALFSPREALRRVPTVCEGCDIFEKYPKPARHRARRDGAPDVGDNGRTPELIQIKRPAEREQV